MRTLPIIVVLACVVLVASAEEAAPSRGGLLKRGLLTKGKPVTTTTTTASPQQEEEYVDEAEYQEGDTQASSEAPVTSTEGKKLVAGGVRPFRSNTDLLEALKRRRAQAAEAKLHHSSNGASAASQADSTAEAPAKPTNNKKRFNSSPAKEGTDESAAAKPTRSRFGRPGAKAAQEPELEEQDDTAPVVPAPGPAPVRTGRTFRRN